MCVYLKGDTLYCTFITPYTEAYLKGQFQRTPLELPHVIAIPVSPTTRMYLPCNWHRSEASDSTTSTSYSCPEINNRLPCLNLCLQTQVPKFLLYIFTLHIVRMYGRIFWVLSPNYCVIYNQAFDFISFNPKQLQSCRRCRNRWKSDKGVYHSISDEQYKYSDMATVPVPVFSNQYIGIKEN